MKVMRNYYIHFYDDANANAYRLYYICYWDQRDLLPAGARRITARDAEKLARQERCRQIRRRPGAGAADAAVFPVDYDRNRSEIAQDERYMLLKDWLWVLKDQEE